MMYQSRRIQFYSSVTALNTAPSERQSYEEMDADRNKDTKATSIIIVPDRNLWQKSLRIAVSVIQPLLCIGTSSSGKKEEEEDRP